MGRKRTRDFDLPPRMVRRRGPRGDRYYYVTHDRRWIPLGPDLAQAKRLWADHECIAHVATVEALLNRYLTDCVKDLAPATRKQYRIYSTAICGDYGDWRLDTLKPFHLARFRDSRPAGMANGSLSLLKVAYAKAIEWGWCETNPAAQVKRLPSRIRDEYLTDAVFRAIREKAPEWLRTAMDLSYLTALRPSDVVKLQWSDVTPDSVFVRVQKTKARIAFAVTEALAAVLAEARRKPVVGLYVVATAKGRPISLKRMGDAWRDARAAAGVTGAQFRDIRAKAATDAAAAGMDYQAMLGHATKAMSDRYVKAMRTIKAQPLRAIK
jgi:integrase